MLRGLTGGDGAAGDGAGPDGAARDGAGSPPGPAPSPAPVQPEAWRARAPGPDRPASAAPPDELDEQLRAVLRRARAGDGAARRAARWAGALLGGAAARQRALAEVTEGLRRPVSTGRRIAVCGVGGGAGATTVTALLASAYAQRRGDPVLAVDAVPDVGWLAWRLGVAPADARDLDAAVGPAVAAPASAYEQLTVLPATPAGLKVLPAPRTSGAVGLEEALALLGRYFAVTVLDAGAWPAGVADAHVPLLVARASPDGVRRTVTLLAGLPAAVPAPPVLLVSHDPADDGVHVPRALDLVRRTGATVSWLPFDRHLAAGGPLEPGRVAERTVLRVSEVAAALLDRSLDGHAAAGATPRAGR